MAAWINMSLGVELGLGQGDFVLDGDPALPPPNREWVCFAVGTRPTKIY